MKGTTKLVSAKSWVQNCPGCIGKLKDIAMDDGLSKRLQKVA